MRLYNTAVSITTTFSTPIEADLDWHRIAFLITSSTITFYYDGNSVATMNIAEWSPYNNWRGSCKFSGTHNDVYIDEVLVCEGSGGIYPEHGPYYLE
jgi:hypothetical protein